MDECLVRFCSWMQGFHEFICIKGKKGWICSEKTELFLKRKKKLKSLLIDRHIKLLICNNSIYAQIYIGKNKIMLLHLTSR